MRLLLLALLVLGATAAPAQAVVVEGRINESRYGVRFLEVTVRADPGETNVVSVRRERGAVIVEDAGAPTRAGGPCATDGEHRAICTGEFNDVGSLTVQLRDGDDRLRADAPVQADGGAGNDELRGSSQDDVLAGGAGGDRLFGGHGADRLAGRETAGAGDALDGGAGDDVVSYGGRRDAVRVDMSTARGDGADRLVGIENATGGDGDDHLIGSRRGDELDGAAGDDVLLGRDGVDRLITGTGSDRADGGPNGDTLIAQGFYDDSLGGGYLRDGGRDELVCAGGEDDTVAVRPGDRVDRSCEKADLLGVGAFSEGAGNSDEVRLVGRVSGRTATVATFRVACEKRRCPFTFEARGFDGRVLGRRRVAAAFARTPVVALRLNALGRRRLARQGSLGLRLRLRGAGASVGLSTVVRRR